MPKYIRTKDTLASVEREEDIELFKRVGQKVADTIEELCDEFVITKHGLDSNFLMEYFEDVKENFVGNSVVYGAIWTEWGLKYVAKMNDKGELELL